MAHSGKTITFATDLLPNEDGIYNLGNNDAKWKIYGVWNGANIGNITNDGKIGTTANYAVYTTTGGTLTAGSLAVTAPSASGSCSNPPAHRCCGRRVPAAYRAARPRPSRSCSSDRTAA